MATSSSEIKILVGLDDNKVPETLEWSAEDGGLKHASAKAMLLSVWDKKSGDTLKIDLWTKDMMADEMKKFVHQSLMALADTLERSTNEKAAAEEMRSFGLQIGEKMNLIQKNK